MKLTLLIFILNVFCTFGQVEAPSVEFPSPPKPQKQEIVIVGGPEPEYPGGFEALKQHIQRYTYNNWQDEETSKCGYVSFVVEADGSLMEIQVVRGISEELDDLMLRIVEEMPHWIPACDTETCYRSRVRLPIVFFREEE